MFIKEKKTHVVSFDLQPVFVHKYTVMPLGGVLFKKVVLLLKKKKVAEDQKTPFHLQMDQVRREGGEGW